MTATRKKNLLCGADGLNRLKHTDQESQKRKPLFFNLSSQNKVFVIGIKKNIRKEAF